MSCFIVNEKHINTLVNYLKEKSKFQTTIEIEGKRLSLHDPSTLTKVGNVLVCENFRSYNYRYDEHENSYIYNYHFDWDILNMNPVQIIKACHCLNYQSCECPDYNESEAKRIIDTIKTIAICNLPGYDEAKWEITEEKKESKMKEDNCSRSIRVSKQDN